MLLLELGGEDLVLWWEWGWDYLVVLIRLLLDFLFGSDCLIELEAGVLARLELLGLSVVLRYGNLHEVAGGFGDLGGVEGFLLVAEVAGRLLGKTLHVAAVRLTGLAAACLGQALTRKSSLRFMNLLVLSQDSQRVRQTVNGMLHRQVHSLLVHLLLIVR